MPDAKISALSDGAPLVATDEFIIARSGQNYKIDAEDIYGGGLVYKYTVTGSDKASIDTGVDTPDAGTNDWANGSLLEVYMMLRTDDAAASVNADLTLNNDTGSNYDYNRIIDTNATVTGSASVAQAAWSLTCHGAGGTAGYAAALRLLFPAYAGTTFNKTCEGVFSVIDGTAANHRTVVFNGGYRSTSAITRLKITCLSTAKFKVGSQLLIYKR